MGTSLAHTLAITKSTTLIIDVAALVYYDKFCPFK